MSDLLAAFPGAELVTYAPRPASLPLAVLGPALTTPELRLLQALMNAANLDEEAPLIVSLAGVLRTAPRGVLLIGQDAVDVWRKGYRRVDVARVSGRVGLWVTSLAVMPLDVAGAMGSRSAKAKALSDLERFRWVVNEELSPLDVTVDPCAEAGCWEMLSHLDDQAIGWCESHWTKGKK